MQQTTQKTTIEAFFPGLCRTQGLTQIQVNKYKLLGAQLLTTQEPLSCPVAPLHSSIHCRAIDPIRDMQQCLPPVPSLSSGTASGRPCQSPQAHGRVSRACRTSSGLACSSSRSGQSLGLCHHKWGNSVPLLLCSRKAGKNLLRSSKSPS